MSVKAYTDEFAVKKNEVPKIIKTNLYNSQASVGCGREKSQQYVQ